MNESELVALQEWRCSVKQFDATKKIPAATWSAIEKSLVLSPSSYGLQPWKFIVITSDEVKKQLTPLSWNQTQVSDCSHFVVLAYRKTVDATYVDGFVRSIAETRGVPLEKLEGYRKAILGDVVDGPRSKIAAEWATRQVYIALGNLMTSAAALAVDTCPMEGITPAAFDEVLGLTGTDYATVVACAVGYRHADDAYSKMKKVRFSAAQIVKHV